MSKRRRKKEQIEMYINAREGGEIRIAILKNGLLDQYFAERIDAKVTKKGNIFVGKVTNIDEGLQAAFVDLGQGPQGFLAMSDVKYPDGGFGMLLRGSSRKKKHTKKKPGIKDVLRKGQKVAVQITREAIGHKGPSVTTFLSIPGRFLVLLPESPDKTGISRKITDDEERKRLKKLFSEPNFSNKHGFIFRTVSIGCSAEDVRNDLKFLEKTWKSVAAGLKSKKKAPFCVYQDGGLIHSIFRDIYNEKINKVFVDSREAFDTIGAFSKDIIPGKVKGLQLAESRVPLFEKFGIEDQLVNIFKREVPLKSGGSVVIEQTEAMIAIDVNSGTYHHSKGQEHVALTTNMEAAEEIARQIRLRKMGGLVCIDFIDMEEKTNRSKVEQALRNSVKNDKEKVDILPISEFGICEMTRQRTSKAVIDVNYDKCPVCAGKGKIKSKSTMAFEMFRTLKNKKTKGKEPAKCTIEVHPDMLVYLLNENRMRISDFEADHNIKLEFISSDKLKMTEIIYR